MSIKLQLPKVKDLRPRITVVGIGGAGGNAVNNMIAAGLGGVDFVVANTDAQALLASSAEHRIQLGANLTEGLGAGSRPEIGEAAAEEALEDIRNQVMNSHMVFVAAGMGGGTGTGAAAVVARIAKEEGVLVVGIVTKPFQFEGARRQRIAEAGIVELKKHVDTLIVIPNQNLFRIANEKTTFAEAFVLADQVLYSGISCIVDLIVKEGLINLDFADVRTILSDMGTAMMGTGEANGERRAILAAEDAIANPLLDEVSLKGAKGLLLSIIGGRNLTLYEVDEAASRVRQEVDADANIIVGATFDESLGDRVRVSIVASGMNRDATAGARAPDASVQQPVARQAHATPSQHPGTASGPPPGHSPAGTRPAEQRPGQAQRPGVAAAPQPAQGTRAHQPQAQSQSQPQHRAAMQPPVAAAPPAAPARVRADAEAEDLRQRLTAAMGAGEPYEVADDDSPYEMEADANATIAGAPWRAPGDVYIEEGPPQLTQAAVASPSARDAAQAQSTVAFQPAAPNEIRRTQQRRMPELEDFPAVGQRDYRAKAAAPAPASRAATGPAQREAAAEAKEVRRRPGLLERITGRGRRASEPAEPPRTAQEQRRVPDPSPSQPHAQARAPAAAAQRPAAQARVPAATPDSGAPRRAAGGGQNVELPVFFSRDGK